MSNTRGIRLLFIAVFAIFVFTLIKNILVVLGSSSQVAQQLGGQEHSLYVEGSLELDVEGYSGDLGNIKKHLLRSEHHYQAMIKQRADLLETYVDPNNKSLFPCDSQDAYWITPFSVWDLLPASFNCPHSMVRLGRLGDGGKWLCGLEKHVELPASRRVTAAFDSTSPSAIPRGRADYQPGCIIYSFGIQNESSFERELLHRTSACQLWGYDLSVTEFGPELHDTQLARRAHFTQAAIAELSNVTEFPPEYAIHDLMAKNGHDHVDIMKMDIEGWEFVSIASFVEHFLKQGKPVPVAQLLVEIHLDPGVVSVDDLLDWWMLLEGAGFRPVWTEPNLLTTTIPLSDGKPRFSEYTFINIRDSRSPLFR